MNFLNQIIPEEYVHALGWTFLHSIWQVAVIALLVGFLMIFLQRSSKVRYIVSAGALPLVLIISLATFYISFESAVKAPLKAKQTAEVMNSPPELVADGSEGMLPIVQKKSIIAQFKTYFSSHFPLIITIWFLGILVLTLRFLGGLAYAQRLKRYKVTDITSQWESKISLISQKMGLNKTIRLLESSLVTVPMVVGYLKPVILLPIGAVTGLSTAQVESILAHELAHIARKDYLINIIQTLIEILFFYHPAIWWISSRVREERENCCDDIAVQINENTLVYAKALATLGEMHIQTPRLAMAATGNNGILFKRIKRMLTKPNQHATFSEGFITACALFICIFCFSFVAKASLTSTFYEPLAFSEKPDLAMDHERELSATVLKLENTSGGDDNLIIVKNKKGDIVELYVNGRKIPRNEIKNYEHLIQEGLAQQKEERSIGNKFSSEDEIALNRMVDELKEKPIERKRTKEDEKIERRKEQKIIIKSDSKDVVNSFVQKTLEIARMGMEIGSLNLEMETLKRKMSRPGENNKDTEAEIKRLERDIKRLEEKAERLGQEIEASGEEMGKWSIDLSTSIMDSVMDGFKFDFNWSNDDDDEDDDDDDDNDQ